MILLYLAVATAAPLILIVQGKRWLGASTHPAAVFILAWMLCALILGQIEGPPVPVGVIALLWVAVCFPLAAVWRKRKAGKTPQAIPSPDDQSPN